MDTFDEKQKRNQKHYFQSETSKLSELIIVVSLIIKIFMTILVFCIILAALKLYNKTLTEKNINTF